MTSIAKHSLVVLLLAAGCSSAVDSGSSTALDAVDLRQMTDDMATAISSSPAVLAAIKAKGTLKIVVEPVVNDLRAEVITPGEADAFTGRVRTLLSRKPGTDYTWIVNRATFDRLRHEELEGVDLGPSPDVVNPEYALTATFTSLADENRKGRTDYYVCNYSLTNLADRSVLWTRSYELQKRAAKGFLD